jgi:hypothetical protein
VRAGKGRMNLRALRKRVQVRTHRCIGRLCTMSALSHPRQSVDMCRSV